MDSDYRPTSLKVNTSQLKMSQTSSELDTALQALHLYEEEPTAVKVHKTMFELLAELLMPDDLDLAFVAMADYIIKTPASHKLLQEYEYIANYLRRQIDETMTASPHLHAICLDLSTILSRI